MLTNMKKRVQRALERRYGQSVMPIRFKEYQHVNGGEIIEATDVESGAWVKCNVSGSRVTVMEERGPTA